ncbi:MAG: hypothetical protein RIT04_651 [Candidatus Parcubacteria bacterium]|jgi:prepilin-type N-terminal cleavage/methylation domain-containing protein
MKIRSGKEGFTLIELLVVISIIGLLSSIVLASLSVARAKSRDAARIQSILQIRTALELYKTSNGSYPLSANGGTAPIETGPGAPTNVVANVPLLFGSSGQIIPTLLRSFKVDTTGIPSDYYFGYWSDGVDYFFAAVAYLERPLPANSQYIFTVYGGGFGPYSITIFSNRARAEYGYSMF